MQKLADAARECLDYLMTVGAAGWPMRRGWGSPPMVAGLSKAPYDVLADTLRGTRGIMVDRFRQPGKILEACERFVPIVTEWGVRQTVRPGVPLSHLCPA